MIGIINYGSGNIQAIANIYNRNNTPFEIINEPKQIKRVDNLILPGVGAYDAAMKVLNSSGLRDALDEAVLVQRKPILGICVGMQILGEGSDEGECSGLGWIKGKTVAFDKAKLASNQKIPNMGWTDVANFSQSRLFENMHQEARFYFVHSFHLELENKNDCLVTAKYGYDFAAGIEHDNILGVQFHPEKSHKYGMKLLENFAKIY
jgi:glutamine amidotransferase